VTEAARQSAIAIVGGGIAGLAAARTLAESGVGPLTLFEKDGELGGLCGSVSFGGRLVDRFYHVVLPADAETLGWIRDLGLQDDLVWSRAGSGFFGRGRIVPLSTGLDFLRFPFLRLSEKIRLGRGILAVSRRRGKAAEAEGTAEPWLRARFGAGVTEKIWLPLLRSKFGDAAAETPAAFMAETIRRLRGARSGTAGRERWGALRGGINSLVRAAGDRVRKAGVEIRTGEPVLGLTGESEHSVRIRCAGGEERFAAAILALPASAADRMINPEAEPVAHLGVVAVVLTLRRSLSPYYVLNLLDPGLPFTGVIESTNVRPPDSVGGLHLVYLPKYISPGNPLEKTPDDEVMAAFSRSLGVVFPDLRPEDIVDRAVVRASDVQPLGASVPPRSGPAIAESSFPIFRAEGEGDGITPRTVDGRIAAGREAARAVLRSLGRLR
jgi:protoporphyrinogen oxidase